MSDAAWGSEAIVVPSNATATFLFCDLVGSTALMTQLGDDAGDEVRRRCYAVFREAVAASRGTEVKSTGDGLLVIFATSVGDAISCAIAMERGIARLNERNPLLKLGLRVGIAVGEAASEEDDWYGTPVVEAARLCAVALAGQILVADVARHRGHRFAQGVLGRAHVSGELDVRDIERLASLGAPQRPEPVGIEKLDADGRGLAVGPEREA